MNPLTPVAERRDPARLYFDKVDVVRESYLNAYSDFLNTDPDSPELVRVDADDFALTLLESIGTAFPNAVAEWIAKRPVVQPDCTDDAHCGTCVVCYADRLDAQDQA